MASKDFIRFLNFLCIGFVLMKEMASACNMTAVNTCTEILSRSTDSSVITDGISAIPTVQQLKKLCGAMNEFKACYKPKAAQCSRDVVFSMTFGTIENTIEYLCVEGYKDILEHASCWNRSEVITESTKCHIAQNSMIATLHSQQMAGLLDSTAMRASWCEILENTTTCMRAGVQPKCGDAAACIMHTMMTRALKGLASLMKCPTISSPTSCQSHSDGTEDSHGHPHTDHGIISVNSDGTHHTHGDSHHDHADDGQADAEVTADSPGNDANTPNFNSFIIFITFSVTLFCIFQNLSQ